MTRCQGTTKRGTCCKLDALPDNDGYCKWHNPDTPICKGLKKDGIPCRAAARDNGYCRRSHMPDVKVTDLDEFRIYGLRDSVGPEVVERRGVDAYTELCVSVEDLQIRDDDKKLSYEIDHIVEVQLFRDTFDEVVRTDSPQKRVQQECLKFLKRTVVNEFPNLNLTTRGINATKGRAVYQCLLDIQNGDAKEDGYQGLRGALLAALPSSHNETRRDYTRRICTEMLKSAREMDGLFELEQPMHEEFADEFYRNVTLLKLK
jgi:hypothetical protein